MSHTNALADRLSRRFNELHTGLQALRIPVGARWLTFAMYGLAALIGASLGAYATIARSLPPLEFGILTLLIAAPFSLIIAMQILGGLERLLLVMIIFDLSIGLDLNLFYAEWLGDLSAVSGLTISLITLCLVALYGWWLLRHMAGYERFPLRALLTTSKAYVTYTALTIFSIVVATDYLLATFEINLVVQGLLLYMAIVYTVKNRNDVHFLMIFLILGLGLQGSIMIMLKAIGGTLDLGIIKAAPDPYGRLSGTVGGPNQSASFFVMWLGLTFGMLLTPVSARIKAMGVAVIIVTMPALLFTYSRGGWIACAITFGLTGLVAWWRKWLPTYVPFAVALIAPAVLVPAWPHISGRLFGDDGGSAEARLPLIRLALLIIRDHPILGVGANNYIYMFPQYLTSEFATIWIRVVHNKYLLIWAEAGIGALLAWLWFLFQSLQRGWQVVRLNDPYLSPLALGLITAIIGWMVHMQVALFHDRVQVMSLCIASGFIAAMNHIARSEA